MAAGPHTARCGSVLSHWLPEAGHFGRHLIAGEALPDRLVLAGTAVDIGETALRL